MHFNLLATKLHRPPMPPKRIARPHLVQRLNEGLVAGRRVTLVSAPAGFGKTTCISEWLDELDCPVTWLSLDAADDDPGRFCTYLVAALQKVDGRLGKELEGVLRAGQLPPVEAIGTTLANDILAVQGRFLLVLDDVQVIQEPEIYQVLGMLVASPLPPLHLVVITREDPSLPLARLRANNQLTELRAQDLRFTSHEAGRFLEEVMGLSLSPEDVTALEDKTEGWIAGLQLAGLSVRDRADPSRFIANLSGSHRFILSYLTEQVFSRQPQEIQGFLVQTSILDRLNGDLCDAVTGRSDSRTLLERLYHANLFLTALDDEQQWYRTHHLFADMLRGLQGAVDKDEMAKLHRRASRWYAQASTGEREPFASEAIQHALAAEDYALAVEMLESHAMGMIMQGYARTVNGWVQAIPEQWRSQSPRTDLAFAWMNLLRGAYAEVFSYLERLRAALASPEVRSQLGEDVDSLMAEWLVMQSLVLNMQGKLGESMTMATRALETAPEQESRVRSLAYYALGSGSESMGDHAQAVEAFQKAIQYGRAAENPVAEMMSVSGLALTAFEHGQLHLAYEIAAPEIAREEGSASLPPIRALVYGMLGEVCYQWYQIEDARRYSLRALQLSTLGGISTGRIGCRVFLSRLSQIEGDLEAAAAEIQKAAGLLPVEVPAYARQELVAQQVSVYLARNRPAAAEMALQGLGFSFGVRFTFPDLPPGESLSHSMGLLYNSSLRVVLHQARAGRDLANLAAGIELADRLIEGALQAERIIDVLESLLLRAQMHALFGNGTVHLAASQADYARALELGEPEGFIGVFVEQGPPVAGALATLARQNRLGSVQPGYVERILAAVARSHSPGTGPDRLPAPGPAAETVPVALVEPLTERELDVLRLMAEGLKYKEIASRLFISMNTVRFHVKAIYGKLGVNNRTQAISMAQQLRLL